MSVASIDVISGATSAPTTWASEKASSSSAPRRPSPAGPSSRRRISARSAATICQTDSLACPRCVHLTASGSFHISRTCRVGSVPTCTATAAFLLRLEGSGDVRLHTALQVLHFLYVDRNVENCSKWAQYPQNI
eukprot:6068699-Prymnesium_polylepis.2